MLAIGDVDCNQECIAQCPCTDSLSRHPGDSSWSYFICARGKAERFECIGGFNFDPKSQVKIYLIWYSLMILVGLRQRRDNPGIDKMSIVTRSMSFCREKIYRRIRGRRSQLLFRNWRQWLSRLSSSWLIIKYNSAWFNRMPGNGLSQGKKNNRFMTLWNFYHSPTLPSAKVVEVVSRAAKAANSRIRRRSPADILLVQISLHHRPAKKNLIIFSRPCGSQWLDKVEVKRKL